MEALKPPISCVKVLRNFPHAFEMDVQSPSAAHVVHAARDVYTSLLILSILCIVVRTAQCGGILYGVEEVERGVFILQNVMVMSNQANMQKLVK